jgi:hypothetical protein
MVFQRKNHKNLQAQQAARDLFIPQITKKVNYGSLKNYQAAIETSGKEFCMTFYSQRT